MQGNRTLNNIWWFNPINVYIMLLFLVIYAYLMPESSYQDLYGVRRKNITEFYVLLYVINFLVFAFGVKTSRRYGYVDKETIDITKIQKVFKFLFFFCLLAYIVWFGNFIRMHGIGGLFTFYQFSELSENMYEYRNASGRISGLTTMTEFGIVVAPLAAYLYRETNNKYYIKCFALIFILSIMRSFLFSERLAFIEILVPFVCAFIAYKPIKTYHKLVPVYAVIFLLLLFGLFEYPRSWSSYYVDHYDGTFVQFVIDRLLGYYCVAVNTECAVIEHTICPYFPVSLDWLWELPGGDYLLGDNKLTPSFGTILNVYGNPEFNNPGGLMMAYRDLGIFGFIITYLTGKLFGLLYNAFITNHCIGLILYPCVMFFMLELPRYFILFSTKAFFIIIGMILISKVIKRARYV